MKIANNLEEFFKYPRQTINIQAIPTGSIVDIGGGGEGIIAQIGRKNVTVIDKLQSEIDEAKPHAPEATWILADATQLEFSDSYFDNATAFFSGMYMTETVLKRVFKEIYRVLQTDGGLWIWDAVISYDIGPFIIPVRVIAPNGKEIETAYGKRRVIKDRTLNQVSKLLVEVGFSVERGINNQFWYSMKAKKL
jgi:ubiquinone/menaquinone biosynthesis C-methylase UbiE